MMTIDSSAPSDTTSADINVTAHGDRRMLESVYLQLRQLALQNGLKIAYRLSPTEPTDQTNS
jgi:hypothetical protein